MADIASQIYFRFLVWPRLTLRRSNAIAIANFNEIFQSTADIVLLPFSENKWLPSWNSTSGFDIDL